MNNLKILYIDNANSIEDIRIAEQTIFYKEFSKLGHDVHFLLQNKKVRNNSQISFYKASFFSKLFINLPLAKALLIIIRKQHFDVIVTRNLLCLSLIPLIICKWQNIFFIYIKAFPLSEVYYQKYITSKGYACKLFNLFRYQINNVVEKIILNHADLVCPRTVTYMNYLHLQKNIEIQKMYPLPMGFDTDYQNNLDSFTKNQIQKRINVYGKKVVIYFGTLEKEREIHFIIDILKLCIMRNDEIIFLVIGGTEKEHIGILNYAEKLDLKRYLVLIPHIKRIELFAFIQIADISISPIPPRDIYLVSSPTKVVESLGFGIPTIVNYEIRDQDELVRKSEGGISVPYDRKAFSDAIIYTLNNKSQLELMSEKGKEYITTNRSYSKLAKEFETYIYKMIK